MSGVLIESIDSGTKLELSEWGRQGGVCLFRGNTRFSFDEGATALRDQPS